MAGFILFLLLYITGGTNLIIGLVADVVPGLQEAFPCTWMDTPDNLANDQSTIGRRAVATGNPLVVRVRPSVLPNVPDAAFTLDIYITNTSAGAVPFVYNPDQVVVGDPQTSGLGVLFDPPENIFTPGITSRQDQVSYPVTDLRVLGPNQTCHHRLTFTANQLPASLTTGQARVRAYYRGTNAGQAQQVSAVATPVFADQGLWTGYVESVPVLIPVQR